MAARAPSQKALRSLAQSNASLPKGLPDELHHDVSLGRRYACAACLLELEALARPRFASGSLTTDRRALENSSSPAGEAA
jgi:hypothetical protein